MRLWPLVAVVVAMFSLGVAKAAAPSDAVVARAAQQALAQVVRPDGPGAAVLIAKGDRVIYRGGVGRAEIELGVPLAPDQVFRIASVTKMFTAAMVLKLAEQHRLSLDDPLSAYVPDIPNGERITIRQLLNHTAGVADKSADPQPGFSRREKDTATLVADIRKRTPAFEPGARWSYSNAGFVLLGAVIEKVTDRPWHEAMREALFQPLDMTHTRYGTSGPIVPGRVAGYTTDTPTHAVANAGFVSITTPGAAGGLESTLDDLRQWMRALAGGRVVGEEGFRQMTTPAPVLPGTHEDYGYGFGMYLWRVRGAPMIGHTGQIDGFASALAYLPDRDLTIVVLANNDNFDARIMARRLAAIALGQPYVQGAVKPMSDAELQALAGTYRRDERTIETLSIKDHRLYAQRGGGNVIPLQMTEGLELHFMPDELSYFKPVRDAAGRVTRLDYFNNGEGPPQVMQRID